ncbi:ribonuclease III [bacterium]|nr:ribonuclease III [bacterium]
MEKNLKSFLKKLGLEPKNLKIFKQAFVHRSYLNESPFKESNERLEFLGDAVLELLATEYLYRNLPNKEGDLSAIRAASVRTSTLAVVSQKIGLNNFLLLSKGEEQTGGRKKEGILADLFEAFLGAVYLDQGFEKAEEIFKKFLLPYLKDIIKNKKYIDPKTYLQEITQERWRALPKYKLVEEKGPDHSKTFVIEVYVGENFMGKGEGPSKQRAEEEAARNALHNLLEE